MCIIAYKPKGKQLFDFNTIKNCMDNNKDGSGYMFNIDKGVFIRKGFNSPKTVLKTLKKDLKAYNLKDIDVDIVFHARIGTQGKIKPENCHPFPITDNISELQSTCIISKFGIVHNGMISIEDELHENLSDTQIYIRSILSKFDYPLPHHLELLVSLSVDNSKIIIMNKDGLLHKIGKFIECKGYLYSNTGYEKTTYSAWDGNTKYVSKFYNKHKGYTSAFIDADICDYCGMSLDKDELIIKNYDGYTLNLCQECSETFDIE